MVQCSKFNNNELATLIGYNGVILYEKALDVRRYSNDIYNVAVMVFQVIQGS